MIEIMVYSGAECVSRAEAEDPEAALLAGRILWDEAWSGLQGQKRQVVFLVDGKTRIVSNERP